MVDSCLRFVINITIKDSDLVTKLKADIEFHSNGACQTQPDKLTKYSSALHEATLRLWSTKL